MYRIIHRIFDICWRYFIVLPFGMMFFLSWYLMFPATALYGLIACEDYNSFKFMIKDLYVCLPRDFFKWCILGW